MGSRTSTSVAVTLESFQRQRQRRKMNKQRILFCFAWMVAQVSGTYNEQARLNRRAIESQWLTLEDSVMRDVLELKESFNKIVGDINTAFGEYRAFTEGSVTELNLHIESEMKQNDEALEENTKLLEDFTKSQVKEMDKTLLENLQTLSSTMAQERSSIVSWAHQRSTFHEDILKTDVALCAFDYDDEKRTGVVNYNGRHSGYLTDQKSWRVFNETCNQESCAKEVLNRDTGRFTVPQNADGLYLFTFSITMDTFDYLEGHTWDYYYFRKNGHKVAGTGLYGNVGSNPHSDMFPGSRTIILDLEAGDYVDIFQTKGKAVPDLQALFCGSLIHLTKASASPGGWAADKNHPSFPQIATDFVPNNVNSDPKTLEYVELAYGEFGHKTKDSIPASRTEVENNWLNGWKLHSDDVKTFIKEVVDDMD